VIAINDADTKHLFDNRYGTGQSTFDGVLRAPTCWWPGHRRGGRLRVVRAGRWRPEPPAWGRGCCHRDQPAAARSRPRWTATRWCRWPRRAARRPLRDRDRQHLGHPARALRAHAGRAIVCNSGHFNVELDLPALAGLAAETRPARPFVQEYAWANGRRVFVLGEGRLINLAAAEGHRRWSMDMSFANQSLSVEYLSRHAGAIGRR